MADGLQMFITGTQCMIDATDITNVSEFPIDTAVIEKEVAKGILKQDQGKENILNIIEDIVKIINRIRR